MNTQQDYTEDVQVHIRTLQRDLCLQDWDITWEWGNTSTHEELKQSDAFCKVNVMCRSMKLVLDDHINPKFYRYYIAHELSHIVLAPVAQLITALPKVPRAMLELSLHTAIDQFGVGLSKERPVTETELLPTPPWEMDDEVRTAYGL